MRTQTHRQSRLATFSDKLLLSEQLRIKIMMLDYRMVLPEKIRETNNLNSGVLFELVQYSLVFK